MDNAVRATSPTLTTTTQSFPDGWGVFSKVGLLKDVLLGDPTHFEWYPTSAISKATLTNLATRGISYDHELAQRQHTAMVKVYEEAGVRVHFASGDEFTPYAVYTRDSSVMTPWGPVIMSLQPPVRRRDHATAADFYREAGIPIWKWITAGHMEGGDVVIIEPGVVMIGYCEERSQQAGAEQLASWFKEKGWHALVVANPAHFVHMDALVLPAAPKTVAICLDALENYVVDFLRTYHYDFIDVPYRDCVRLGCNIMPLGGDRVLSLASNETLNKKLEALGLKVYPVDISMFALGGGGVHCLSMEIRREAE